MRKGVLRFTELVFCFLVVTGVNAEYPNQLLDLEYRIHVPENTYGVRVDRARAPSKSRSNDISRIGQSSASEAALEPGFREYHISPGDVISVRVFGEPELSLEDLRVPRDGLVSYPLLGQILVQNHTVRSLERHLTALLANGYLRKPKVSISIIRYRPVFVRGGVNSAGAHDYSEGLTVEKAIALAGGLSKQGRLDGTMLLRDTGESMIVDLDAPVLPGDVISVPEAAESEAKSFIYLYGEVNKPGSYEYRKGLTVEKALALAGGFSERASKRKIEISREDAEGETVRLKKVDLDVSVKPGDVITVGASLF